MTDLTAIRARLEAGYPGEDWEGSAFADISDLLDLAEQQAAEIERLKHELALAQGIVVVTSYPACNSEDPS